MAATRVYHKMIKEINIDVILSRKRYDKEL